MPDDKKKPGAPQTPSAAEQPEIYGITRGKNGIVLNRRSFLGAVAASGVLAACGRGDDTPDAPTQGCGNSKAHEYKITGLLMQDGLLFSWDATTLKAWELAKGRLMKKAVWSSELEKNLETNGGPFPYMFLHIGDYIRDADMRTMAMAIGPGGKILAIPRFGGVALWKAAEGKLEKSMTLPEAAQPVPALAFSPDGTKLAAGIQDGSITIWNTADRKVQHRLRSADSVCSLAFHPDGAVLLSGHVSGKALLWQLPEGKAAQTLDAHAGLVRNVKMAPNGALAVTSGEDGSIKLWDMPGGELKSSLAVPSSGITTAMDISQDSRILTIGTAEGHISLWRLPEGTMTGCLFDPDLTPQETQMAQYRQMGAQILTQPCGTDLPEDATCVCDCVGDNQTYSTTQTVCTCDTIVAPAGRAGSEDVCVCNTVGVGSMAPKAAPGCTCVGNVPRGGGGSHYWRPN
jgi:hypothetical protein